MPRTHAEVGAARLGLDDLDGADFERGRRRERAETASDEILMRRGRYRGCLASSLPESYLVILSGVRFVHDMESLCWLQHHCRCGCASFHRAECPLKYARETPEATAGAVRAARHLGHLDPCVVARRWHTWTSRQMYRRAEVVAARAELERRLRREEPMLWEVPLDFVRRAAKNLDDAFSERLAEMAGMRLALEILR